MKERPILFSGPMVRAILDGTKTMTRRLVKPQPNEDGLSDSSEPIEYGYAWRGTDGTVRSCPYGVPGDRLWVRETHAPNYFDGGGAAYRVDWTGESADLVKEPRWRPSIFMRPADSRITLEVAAVRVERLHDITAADVKAEGLAVPDVDYSVSDDPRTLDEEREAWARGHFATLWEAINGKRAPWASNPWVWCVSFKRVRP